MLLPLGPPFSFVTLTVMVSAMFFMKNKIKYPFQLFVFGTVKADLHGTIFTYES